MPRCSATSRWSSISTKRSGCLEPVPAAAAVTAANWPADWLRSRLGHEARAPELFAAALTHRSATGTNNERLEFLGDAVLNLIAAEHLYEHFPRADEGTLSRLRARLVSGEPLARIAAGLGVGEALALGPGELKTGGFRRESILADALEALCGALYLDAGIETARRLMLGLLAPEIASLEPGVELKDPKTRLQEWLQARGLGLPVYRIASVSGEPHAQHFCVRCEVAALAAEAAGEGSSRRRAEQAAAEKLLLELAP
ncbi:MAG: ribonuclease III [Gammaproteobacteria bacterium]|nr:ribonuclease III [Gammaproteobacteria bacterium]